MQVNIKNLIDDAQCYQTVRELRWPDGIPCPSCASQHVIERGFDARNQRRLLVEGFWSLLHSWLRPHRGISQEQLPLYLSFFEFAHNVRKRGKALLPALIELLVS